MSKFQKIALGIGFAALAVVTSVTPLLGALRVHAADDYTITASDTIPVFTATAAVAKTNGLAVLNVALPYMAAAVIAFGIIFLFWKVVGMFRHSS